MKILKINRSLYSDETIKKAIDAYNNHAVITVSYRQEYAFLSFWKCKYDSNQTIMEFENYMIGLENR